MKEVNYTRDWKLDISNMSESEWNQLVSICSSKSIKLFDCSYKTGWDILSVNNYSDSYLSRYDLYNNLEGETVSILEMFNRLERPIKSAKQLKIDELQRTIELANKQIKELKQEDVLNNSRGDWYP